MQQKFLSKILPSDVGGQPSSVRFVLGNKLEVAVSLEQLDAQTKERLMLHGLAQKVGDAAAGFSKTSDFSGAFGAMQAVADNLLNGVWTNRSGNGAGDLVQAIADLQGVSIETAQAAVDRMDEEQQTTFLKHPAIKAKMAEIKAERAKANAAGVDGLGDLMKELGL